MLKRVLLIRLYADGTDKSEVLRKLETLGGRACARLHHHALDGQIDTVTNTGILKIKKEFIPPSLSRAEAKPVEVELNVDEGHYT